MVLGFLLPTGWAYLCPVSRNFELSRASSPLWTAGRLRVARKLRPLLELEADMDRFLFEMLLLEALPASLTSTPLISRGTLDTSTSPA